MSMVLSTLDWSLVIIKFLNSEVKADGIRSAFLTLLIFWNLCEKFSTWKNTPFASKNELSEGLDMFSE
jgi:hypothetical protein